MRLVHSLAAAILAAAPLYANEVSIAFSQPSSSRVTVELRHVSRVADLAAAPAVLRETTMNMPLTVDLLPGTWALDVRGGDTWHAQQTFNVAADHTVVTANVWPAAIVHGRLDVEGMKDNVELRATFAPADDAPAPVGTVDCKVDKQTFGCRLPATAIDVRLRVRGYVTKFFWNQQLETKKTVDAGTLHFVRGAVLLGRVEISKEVRVAPRSVRVSASPSNADQSATKIALSAALEDRGFFHIDGLPPGRYDVTAVGGKFRSRAVSIVVLPGLTAEMRDVLRIESPKTLRVVMNPALDPSGRPWHVSISQHLSEHHVETISGSAANAAGEWSSPPMYGGTYQLAVVASDGGEWYVDDVQAGDTDVTKNIDLAMQHVKALVSLGGKPLRGTVALSFGTSTMTFDTDDSGAWGGVLPAASGPSEAKITSDTPPVRRSMRDLHFKRAKDSDDAELRIDLPLNAVMGTVVRKDGKPLDGGAFVQIAGGEGLQQLNVAEDGSFFAAGLAAGRYAVSATAFLMDSPAVEVVVEDGGVPDPVRLVLDDSTKVHGQVVSDFGPVAGAEIVLASTDVPQSVSPLNMTDANGEFSTTVSPGAHEIDVFVAAPGFALKLFHTRIREASLIVPVDQRGGRLTVPAPHEGDPRHPYLVHNGMWYPADALDGRFAHAEGGTVVIPAIDPGAYTLCMATHGEANAARHGIMFSHPCSNRFLAPYGSASFSGSN
jgi:hypothetical protein